MQCLDSLDHGNTGLVPQKQNCLMNDGHMVHNNYKHYEWWNYHINIHAHIFYDIFQMKIRF